MIPNNVMIGSRILIEGGAGVVGEISNHRIYLAPKGSLGGISGDCVVNEREFERLIDTPEYCWDFRNGDNLSRWCSKNGEILRCNVGGKIYKRAVSLTAGVTLSMLCGSTGGKFLAEVAMGDHHSIHFVKDISDEEIERIGVVPFYNRERDYYFFDLNDDDISVMETIGASHTRDVVGFQEGGSVE